MDEADETIEANTSESERRTKTLSEWGNKRTSFSYFKWQMGESKRQTKQKKRKLWHRLRSHCLLVNVFLGHEKEIERSGCR